MRNVWRSPMTRRALAAFLLAGLFLSIGCSRHPAHPTVAAAIDEAAPADTTEIQRADPQHPAEIADAANTTEDAVAADPCSVEADTVLAGGNYAPAMPPLSGRVTDLTGTITPECKADLTTRLASLEHETGAQVAVLLVSTTGGIDIEDYANKVFRQWRLGRKGVDDGVLLVVATQDRRARIEVGYGLESTITDGIAGDMLRADLQPNFREKHYNAGVSAVVADLANRIRSTPLAPPAPKRKHASGLAFLLAMILLSAVVGGVSAARNLAWTWRILLPPIAAALCTFAAVPLRLTPGYGTVIAIIPISVGASFLGVPFVRSTRQALQWLATVTTVSALLCILTAVLNRGKHAEAGSRDGWYFAALAGGFFLGSMLFAVVKIVRDGGFHRASSHPDFRDNDRDSDSSSSSSDSSNSSSGSSSDGSDSDSFSGGGGDSGGGGASSSW